MDLDHKDYPEDLAHREQQDQEALSEDQVLRVLQVPVVLQETRDREASLVAQEARVFPVLWVLLGFLAPRVFPEAQESLEPMDSQVKDDKVNVFQVGS